MNYIVCVKRGRTVRFLSRRFRMIHRQFASQRSHLVLRQAARVAMAGVDGFEGVCLNFIQCELTGAGLVCFLFGNGFAVRVEHSDEGPLGGGVSFEQDVNADLLRALDPTRHVQSVRLGCSRRQTQQHHRRRQCHL